MERTEREYWELLEIVERAKEELQRLMKETQKLPEEIFKISSCTFNYSTVPERKYYDLADKVRCARRGNRAMFQEIKRVIGENWPEYKESKKKEGLSARNYKAETARKNINYSRLYIWLKKEAAEKFKAKLEKENKKPTEFIRKAVDEYLKN